MRKHILKHIRDDANNGIPLNDGPQPAFECHILPPIQHSTSSICWTILASILWVLIHASVLHCFTPLSYPIFLGIVVPMFLGLLHVPSGKLT